MPFKSEADRLRAKIANMMPGPPPPPAAGGPGSSQPNPQTMSAQQQAASGGVGGLTVPTAGNAGTTPMPNVTPAPAPQLSPTPVLGGKSGNPGASTTFSPSKMGMTRPEFMIPKIASDPPQRQRPPMLGGFGIHAGMYGVDPHTLREAIAHKMRKTKNRLSKKSEITKTANEFKELDKFMTGKDKRPSPELIEELKRNERRRRAPERDKLFFNSRTSTRPGSHTPTPAPRRGRGVGTALGVGAGLAAAGLGAYGIHKALKKREKRKKSKTAAMAATNIALKEFLAIAEYAAKIDS